MKIGRQLTPGYNVQTAVDTEHALIVATRSSPMRTINACCCPCGSGKTSGRFTSFSERDCRWRLFQRRAVGSLRGPGIVPTYHQAHGEQSRGGKLFDRTEFVYDEKSDTFRCPAGQTLWRKQFSKKDRAVMYTARRGVCGSCALKGSCT